MLAIAFSFLANVDRGQFALADDSKHSRNILADGAHLVRVFERVGVPLQAQVDQFLPPGLDLIPQSRRLNIPDFSDFHYTTSIPEIGSVRLINLVLIGILKP